MPRRPAGGACLQRPSRNDREARPSSRARRMRRRPRRPRRRRRRPQRWRARGSRAPARERGARARADPDERRVGVPLAAGAPARRAFSSELRRTCSSAVRPRHQTLDVYARADYSEPSATASVGRPAPARVGVAAAASTPSTGWSSRVAGVEFLAVTPTAVVSQCTADVTHHPPGGHPRPRLRRRRRASVAPRGEWRSTTRSSRC